MYDELHLCTYGMILLFDVLMTTMKSPHASKAVSLAMITAFTASFNELFITFRVRRS